MYDIKKIGENITALRKKHDFSQEYLAEKLFVSRQAVSKWERGEALPDTENLIALSEFFDVTIDELINGESMKEPNEEETLNAYTPPINVSSLMESIETIVHEKLTSAEEMVASVEAEIESKSKKSGSYFLFTLESYPYPILITIAFLIWGFLGGWRVSWTLYLTIPVYYSVLACCKTKRLRLFAYPAFLVFIYLLLGMLCNLWHPLWVIFITIPIYSFIAETIDNRPRK